MECSSACQIFERFSTALEWIGNLLMPEGLIFHILDDFLIIAQTEQLCKTYLEIFLEICSKIGIPMAPEKTVGPSTLLTFLGIELDTVRQEARLPLEKIQKCLSMSEMFLRRKKVTLEEIQYLCGLLNFSCQVVLPGRTFLRRLFELTRGLEKPHHHVKLKRGCKDDLLVWKEFLHTFNGKYFFLEEKFWIMKLFSFILMPQVVTVMEQ